MPDASTCQYCGKDCGNAGACTNHEESCDHNPANQAEGAAETAPARREAQPPAQGQQQGRTAGDALADGLIAAVDDDLPARQRTQAITQGLGVVGSVISRWQEHRENKMELQEQRAKNVDLEPVDDLPNCSECGYQFAPEDIGLDDDKVRCPGCDALFRLRSDDQPIDA